MKRVLALLLAATMLMLSFAACSTTNESGNEKDTEGDTTPAVDEANTDGDELGEEEETPLPTAPVVDMGGENFHIYNDQWGYDPLKATDVLVEESTGEGINDASFDREAFIEEKLNIDVTQYEVVGIGEFRNAQQASDGSYDLVIVRSNNYDTLITAGAITSFDNLPYFDPNAVWWDAQSYDDFAIGGEHLGMIGDITTNHILCMYGIFFNKEMVAEYGMGDMYQIVRDGKWTFDLMFQNCLAAAKDLDGDPTKWTTDDQIGMSYVGGFPIAMLNACGARLAEMNEDNKIVVKLGEEANLDKVAKIMEWLKDDSASLNHHRRSTDAFNTECGCFVQGRVLYNQGSFYYVPELRLMDQEFGIIPMPKYDESQEEYLSPMGADFLPLICVPMVTEDFEKLSTFMEWFAYYGYDLIRPELLEVLIKGKVSRDVESIEFINFIADNRFYDIGAVFNFGGLFDSMVGLFGGRAGNLASILPRMMTKIEKGIVDMESAVIG